MLEKKIGSVVVVVSSPCWATTLSTRLARPSRQELCAALACQETDRIKVLMTKPDVYQDY
jgi:hypothetical protein